LQTVTRCAAEQFKPLAEKAFPGIASANGFLPGIAQFERPAVYQDVQ
jgi:hypothetical protein